MNENLFNTFSENARICPVCNSYLHYHPSGEWYCPDCSSKHSGFMENNVSGAGTAPPYQMEITKVRVTAFPDYESRIAKLEEELKKLKTKYEGESEIQEVRLRSLPYDEAIQLIQKYIDENPGCHTSDIILNLEIDPDLVLEIIRNLQQSGEIRSEKIK